MTTVKPVIGEILERKSVAKPSAPSSSPSSSKTGFPSVQHRSKSAFARVRQTQSAFPERRREVPVVQPAKKADGSTNVDSATQRKVAPEEDTTWREQLSRQNEARVQAMSEEERQLEADEILGKFAGNVRDILRRAREAREGKQKKDERPLSPIRIPEGAFHNGLSPQRQREGILVSSAPSSGASTPKKAHQKLRFIDPSPEDVHVYESHPPSPKRPLLLLPPPPEGNDDGVPVVKLPALFRLPKSSSISGSEVDGSTYTEQSGQSVSEALEEGTPEDIRRRFFPHLPQHEPSLEWIELPDKGNPDDPSVVRFDLAGQAIPPSQRASLPTHLGLHHHAGSSAGYSLDDVFLLCRSTVPAQRATMMAVLAKIVFRLRDASIAELKGQESSVRSRALATGLEALEQRGSVGAQAIELVWSCTAGWNEDQDDLEGVELKPTAARGAPMDPSTASTDAQARDPMAMIPMEPFLQQVSLHLQSGALPVESMSQLLAILYYFARYSIETATTIVSSPSLINNAMKAFILTPIPPQASSPLPDPLAIRLLLVLSLSSRPNARALIGPTDAVLRFISPVPPASHFLLPLATSLLTAILDLFTAHASYGLYSQIASTASTQFRAIEQYILSPACTSRPLMCSWLNLIHHWIVCATDPHQTTPTHDILWSQVQSWGWIEGVLQMREKLSAEAADREVWSALWQACASWLEGCRVNGVAQGKDEREGMIKELKDGFLEGVERLVVVRSSSVLQDGLGIVPGDLKDRPERLRWLASSKDIAQAADALHAFLRVTLACTPNGARAADVPPWYDPLSVDFDQLVIQLIRSPTWTALPETLASLASLRLRPLSALLHQFAKLHAALDRDNPPRFVALASVVVQRLLPGEEAGGIWLVDQICEAVSHRYSQERATEPDAFSPDMIATISPFLHFPFLADPSTRLGPYICTPSSIATVTTQTFPSVPSTSLPLPPDWPLAALTHLLHSGQSPLFAGNLLPPTWDASEVAIVRASLALSNAVRDTLAAQGLPEFAMSRERTIFHAMEVFMLEHGQQEAPYPPLQEVEGDGRTQPEHKRLKTTQHDEVFRDPVVSALLTSLLRPFTASSLRTRGIVFPRENLDQLTIPANPFSTTSTLPTPFYQFYTDFLALYDAISFGHALFGQLLLVPLSMTFPVDYRKLLWGDYAHVLRSLRPSWDDLLVDDPSSYLWPAEDNADMIAFYMKALVKYPLEGFLRMIAVHHVACAIWEELSDIGRGSNNADTSDGKNRKPEHARLVLKAIVDQANFQTVRDVLLYTQSPANAGVLLPPACFFTPNDPRRQRRLDVISQLGGAAIRERLEGIFVSEYREQQ